jgi:5-formyltetrahydrofolate cyclo-ligase
MESSAAVAEQKTRIRAEVLARRDTLSPDARQAAAEAIAARVLPVAPRPGLVVSGFMPIRSEINPLPLMRRYAGEGAQLALPAIDGRGKPLRLRGWAVGDKLIAGQWGIREPDASAPEIDPDVMLVPLAVFDRRGHRIGYGAGYYDMTIARVRSRKPVVAVGVAFAVQEVSDVPILPHDERLDLVLTEKELIDCRGA